jgi:hypothetical protein
MEHSWNEPRHIEGAGAQVQIPAGIRTSSPYSASHGVRVRLACLTLRTLPSAHEPLRVAGMRRTGVRSPLEHTGGALPVQVRKCRFARAGTGDPDPTAPVPGPTQLIQLERIGHALYSAFGANEELFRTFFDKPEFNLSGPAFR